MSMGSDAAWCVSASDFPGAGPARQQLHFLLRYAILAPSSHNTQPWGFRVGADRVELFVDECRWLRVADVNQRELYVSAGCALENLLIAAERFNFASAVTYFPDGQPAERVAVVTLRPRSMPSAAPPPLFAAITRRHTNHRRYDGKTVSPEMLARLKQLTTEKDIGIHLISEASVRQRIVDLVARADVIQFADPHWRRELGHWLGRGVFGTGWLMSRLSRFAVTHLDMGKAVAKKDAGRLESAPVFGVVTAQQSDRASRVRAGQLFERLFLTATLAGLQIQPMNQVLQVPEIRTDFMALLSPEWGEPQLTFRMGYAEPEAHTPRRPIGEVLV